MLDRYEKLLKKKRYSNADVVRGTGIPSTTLYDWKSGKYELKLDKVIAMAEFFDVSLDYLVLGKESDNEIVRVCEELNEEGRELLLNRANELVKLGYIKNNKAEMVV